MSESNFYRMQVWLEEHGADQHASEVHGLITGWICAGSQMAPAARRSAVADWLHVELNDAGGALIDALYDDAVAGLADEELGFRLLLPDDETEVDRRTGAVSRWCSGFLAGFGMTGRYRDEDLSDEVGEVLTDLGRISAFSEDVPEGEENEADLEEISEYVRMSAMLVYTECGRRAIH